MKMLPLFLFFLSTIHCYARLGETIPECRARYGDPIEADEKARLVAYAAGGLIVMAWFDLDGFCEQIVFSREDKEAFSITQKEILVAANLGDETTQIDAGLLSEGQVNPSGDVSIYDPIHEHLIIRSKAKIEKDAREKEAAERGALKGF